MTQPFDARPISKAARNERRKLLSSSFNTIGLTVAGIGVLTPLITGARASSTLTIWACGAISVVLHLLARRLLRSLED
ncbi:hypothetical protein ACETK8_06370 [Brevundimonas staleyi]|uniref:Amino acid transporter n=1 Tax=Brevundimonas staleyi TaxID=74326 RepID=A0ABW0FMX1_9CAUL